MSCTGGGGAFFRQMDTINYDVSDSSAHVIPFGAPMIAFSWWAVGKRLVFEVPAAGVLYSKTSFGVQLRDNTAMANYVLRNFVAPQGSEIESFRLVCDVTGIANSTVTLKCWIDYPFPIGEDPTQNPFSEVSFDTGFRPLEVQIFIQQTDAVETTVTFQDAEFSGFGKITSLIC